MNRSGRARNTDIQCWLVVRQRQKCMKKNEQNEQQISIAMIEM